MKIKALFFATCRDIVGSREYELEIEAGSQVGDVKRVLMATYPNFPATDKVSVAVNAEYVDDRVILCPGDEIAFIPPVSGG
jgi:molybdopterin converting factor subunit 1